MYTSMRIKSGNICNLLTQISFRNYFFRLKICTFMDFIPKTIIKLKKQVQNANTIFATVTYITNFTPFSTSRSLPISNIAILFKLSLAVSHCYIIKFINNWGAEPRFCNF